jgi:acyl-CoA synthetase (AMP-forming)/AMP-acid ligase II
MMDSTMQDRQLTIGAIARHASAVHAGAEVVTASAGSTRRSSFAEVLQRAARLAGGLGRLGVVEGDRVGTYLWNNQEHLEAYLGVPVLGAVLHTLNVRLAVDEIAAVARHAGDTVVIVGHNLAGQFAPVLAAVPAIRTVIVTGSPDQTAPGVSALAPAGRRVLRYEDVVAAGDERDWQRETPERAAAVMCYTSGTTGTPKGVLYSHRSTVLHAMSVCSGNAVGMSFADRALLLVPMFHANAWGWPFAALMSGAAIVLTDGDLSPAHVAGVIARERVTITGGVPTLWTDVLTHVADQPDADLSSLRLILCGGSAVPLALAQAYRARFGVPVVQAWGMTETSPLGAVARPPAAVDREAAIAYQQTQGRFLFGTEARIADGQDVVCSDGTAQGELQVRGPWVTGDYYLGDQSGAFTEDGWLRTGDLGSLDAEGYLRLTDRSRDAIKSGGEWISSVVLEGVLAEHPQIAEVAVIGVPDDRWQERPLAIVAPRGTVGLTPGELRDWLSGKVARWWLPERWAFVAALPRTSVGKYDKKLLRQQFAAGELPVQYERASRAGDTA